MRVLEVPLSHESQAHDYKRVGGGLLVQSSDSRVLKKDDLKVVTKKQPTDAQWADLLFSWTVAKFVKSNAIVYCRDGMTLGVGAGQMSRVDSARLATFKAQSASLDLAGAAVASDAFFPFRDGLDVVIDAGAVAVIQPGGSMRDDEVIAAADERGVAISSWNRALLGRPLADPGAVAEDRAYTLTQDPYARWRHLTMPTLLVRATRELRPGAGFVVPADDRDRFLREVPRGAVVEVDANHLTVNTHADLVTSVKPFLERASAYRR